MLNTPEARLVVLQVVVLLFALPEGSATVLQPLIVVPSALNTTVPVGAVPVTVAVKVTLVPATDGLAELATAAPLTAGLTTCANAVLVEPLLLLSPT